MFEASAVPCAPLPVVSHAEEPSIGRRLQRRIEERFAVRRRDQWGGRFILHGRPAGPNAIRLIGNDYLGLTGHPDIANAILAAVRHDTD